MKIKPHLIREDCNYNDWCPLKIKYIYTQREYYVTIEVKVVWCDYKLESSITQEERNNSQFLSDPVRGRNTVNTLIVGLC